MPKLLLVGLLIGGLFSADLASAAEPDAARKAELLYRLKHDCGSCHGMTLKGGLGPALLPTSLKQHSNEFLIDIIRDGVAGTPMPPWGVELSHDETAWLVKQLKAGETHAN